MSPGLRPSTASVPPTLESVPCLLNPVVISVRPDQDGHVITNCTVTGDPEGSPDQGQQGSGPPERVLNVSSPQLCSAGLPAGALLPAGRLLGRQQTQLLAPLNSRQSVPPAGLGASSELIPLGL